jgi:hypothetical protein
MPLLRGDDVDGSRSSRAQVSGTDKPVSLRCPYCGSDNVSQRWPTRFHERLARLVLWPPFVCWECMMRFHAFVSPLPWRRRAAS